MKKLIATAILATLPVFATAAPGETAWSNKDASGNVSLNFYVFWSKTCPHCHKALPFVKQMARNNPWIKLKLKEVTDNNDNTNVDQYIQMAKAAGTTAGAVPAFFYCGQIYTGYGENSTTGAWLLEELKACKRNPAEFDLSF